MPRTIRTDLQEPIWVLWCEHKQRESYLTWNREALTGSAPPRCTPHNQKEEERQDWFEWKGIFHIGLSSPAFKGRKEDCSLPPKQCTNPCLQPMGNRHSTQLLFFSSELSSKQSSPVFSSNLIEADLPLSLQTCPRFTIAGLSQIAILCWSRVNSFGW